MPCLNGAGDLWLGATPDSCHSVTKAPEFHVLAHGGDVGLLWPDKSDGSSGVDALQTSKSSHITNLSRLNVLNLKINLLFCV